MWLMEAWNFQGQTLGQSLPGKEDRQERSGPEICGPMDIVGAYKPSRA